MNREVQIKVPYWRDEPQVMYSVQGRYYSCARTIAWFLFGDPNRTEMW